MSFLTAEKVRDIIIKNGMKPGDKLPSESELIELFKVSRTTIREAMKILKAENIIEIQQGRGTFVSKETGMIGDPLGLTFVNQKTLLKNLLEARLLIEPPITLLAAQRANDSDVKDLQDVINKMKELNYHDKNSAELDLEFHKLIAKATGNDVLYRVIPIINESIMKGYGETVNNIESFRRAFQSHLNIFKAIKDKDFLAARYESEKHIRQTLDDVYGY
ncbi:FadR/GntR family transcriptional regulator [Bacillus sp. 1NLA3E]|uniref:FadR/GntR family transcriptional regulator n=1 Tax=Bacillus sp. 1NLA3E TaxID=666686 RepID=UPI000327EFBF|nr:FadR/GntR family transcriptional regulator [Bacillus sp. 1NLA3E]AGK55947.1 GntR family transcriptional regulator [Bacillus sp. 1NLA3E]